MNLALPDWTLIRAFVAVMRRGSLTAAARELGTTQPTVGRQLQQLEAVAGDALFERHGVRMVPTRRARDLFPWAERCVDETTALGRAFALPVADLAGPVRITTSDVFAVHVLPDLIAPLLALHPGLAIEIVATDALSDLMRRDADLAIRFVRPHQPDLKARRVGAVEIGLYASAAYLGGAGRPTCPPDLADHRIVTSMDAAEADVFRSDYGIDGGEIDVGVRSDSHPVRMSAIRAGLGIGPMPVWLGDADDALERVLPALVVRTLPIWLAAHGDLTRSRRLRIVFDHLGEKLARRFGT